MKRSGAIFVVFLSFFFSHCQEKEASIIPHAEPPEAPFIFGLDLSYVNEIEDFGGVYRDSGSVRDPFRICRDHGAGAVRVRLWYDPQWVGALTGGKLYSDLTDATRTIRRAKEVGMKVCLDLHYSDTWADPSKQETPAAWTGLDDPSLRDSVYAYTFRVLRHLKEAGLTPEMVQIGNETNMGMLWPAGKVVNDDWQAFGGLLNAGISAVRDFSALYADRPEIILHVAGMEHASWWIGEVTGKGKVTGFDILGISYYPKWSAVNSLVQITSLIRDIRTKYGKKVMVVETAYPWTAEDADQYPNIMGPADSLPGYPLTVAGQTEFLENLSHAVREGGGSGIFYWEPAWITSAMRDQWGTGSSWDNCTLFDFDGNALSSMQYMKALDL